MWPIIKSRIDDWSDLRELGLLADRMGLNGRAFLWHRIGLALGVDTTKKMLD